MENRTSVTITKSLLAFAALFNFVSPTLIGRAYAYGIETHAGISREIIRFYNQHFPNKKINETDAGHIIQGSRDEDDAPRWMNHFYDPVHNRGLTNFYGTHWMSSKQWANDRAEQLSALYNPVTQTTLSTFLALTNPDALLTTDYTWQRSLEDYARGDVERAFRGLGHILHLLEDASVPDHTRNDPHPAIDDSDYFETGSPYEIWTHRFTVDNINLLQYLYTKTPIMLDSRDAYFDALANYSNKNFYSKDTIDISEYEEPKPNYVLNNGRYYFGYKHDEDGDYKLVLYKNNPQRQDKPWATKGEDKDKSLSDENNSTILRDYWERLAPKAVQYGAGLVDLFLKEAEALKNNPSFPKEKPKSPLARVVDAVRGLFANNDNRGVSSDGLIEVAAIPLDTAAVRQAPPTDRKAQDVNAGARRAAAGERESEFINLSAGRRTEIKNNAAPPQARPADGQASPDFAQGKQGTTEGNSITENKKEPESAPYRPNLAPPKPARFSGAVGKSADMPMQPIVSAPTPCAYATGQSPLRTTLILNEIAWMGSAQNPSDEWIELKNISGNLLDISGWQVVDSSDQIHATFPLGTVIPHDGLFLLERTNDDTVPTIPADYIYEGALGNKKDGVRLFDRNCFLQDEVSGNPWPAGESGTKRTMERALDMMWYTSSGMGPAGILGTPKMENSARQAAQINLSRQALGNAPPVPEATFSTNVSSAATHIVISEVQTGTDAGSDDEFIELYNPTNTEVNLTGWYLKKKTSSGAESGFAAATRLEGKTIPAKSYFLLANEEGYKGSVAPDVTWAKSNTIAYTNNAIVLYDVTGAKVDEASWTEIAKNTSMERKAIENGACVSASGAGTYLGNGCDTDAATDFESRGAPQPQNRANLPEPRSGVSVSSFQVSYDKATRRVAFVWDAAEDARGATSSVRYTLLDASTSTAAIFSGVGTTTYTYLVSNVGRSYEYALQATDAEGLTGDTSRASVTAASPLSELKFFRNPNIGADDARLFLTFDAYPPFAQRTGLSTWQILVFSLNADPVRQSMLDNAGNWSPDDMTNVLAVRYRNYSGYQMRNSLVLPDDAARVGSSGGIDNVALQWSGIEADMTRSPQARKLMLVHAPLAKTFTTADYITVSFYDFGGSGGGNQWFRFAAADDTKYRFYESAPVNQPPTAPLDAVVDRYDGTNAIVGWNPVSTDPDGIDREIAYEVNRATSTAERFFDNTWVRFTRNVPGAKGPAYFYTPVTALPGETYIFGIRAVDEFGYVSAVATTAPFTVPL